MRLHVPASEFVTANQKREHMLVLSGPGSTIARRFYAAGPSGVRQAYGLRISTAFRAKGSDQGEQV